MKLRSANITVRFNASANIYSSDAKVANPFEQKPSALLMEQNTYMSGCNIYIHNCDENFIYLRSEMRNGEAHAIPYTVTIKLVAVFE